MNATRRRRRGAAQMVSAAPRCGGAPARRGAAAQRRGGPAVQPAPRAADAPRLDRSPGASPFRQRPPWSGHAKSSGAQCPIPPVASATGSSSARRSEYYRRNFSIRSFVPNPRALPILFRMSAKAAGLDGSPRSDAFAFASERDEREFPRPNSLDFNRPAPQ